MAKSVITAAQTTFQVREGQDAVAKFNLSTPLTQAAAVKVKVEGWGAQSSSDFGSLMVSFDGVQYTAVQAGSLILPVGTTQVWLKASTRSDTEVNEAGERLAFVIEQDASSTAVLDNSFWVASVAELVDTTPALPTIRPDAAQVQITEGESIVANFRLTDGTLSAAADVMVRLEGYSATAGLDTGAQLQIALNGSGQYTMTVPVAGGVISLPAGTTSFQVRTTTTVDARYETQESLAIVVGHSGGLLKQSEYAATIVTVVDPAAAAPARVQAASSVSVQEGSTAVVAYQLSNPLFSPAVVQARLEGYSATIGTDTGATLQVRTHSAAGWSSWSTVSAQQLTLPSQTDGFELRTDVKSDALAEITEQFAFVVAQTDAALKDSFDVRTVVNVADGPLVTASASAPAPAPAPAPVSSPAPAPAPSSSSSSSSSGGGAAPAPAPAPAPAALNHEPVITVGSQAQNLVPAGGTVAAVASSSIQVRWSDSDAGDVAIIDGVAMLAEGWTTTDAGLTYTAAGEFGTATLNAQTGVMTYTLTPGNAALAALQASASVLDGFEVIVRDLAGAQAIADVSFKIGGAQAPATITGTLRGSVTEDTNLVPGAFGLSSALTYPVAAFLPYSVAVADVDGNGTQDVITAGMASDAVAVLLNDGTGAFRASAVYPIHASSPTGIALADINGDARVDIVTADSNSNSVTVLLNNGSGVFSQPTSYPVGASLPLAVALADVNGDGRVDAVTADLDSHSISVLLNNGNGGFGAPQSFLVGADVFPTSVSLADINGDGHVDAVTSDYGARAISVMLNNGQGQFGAARSFDVRANGPFSIGLADIDGDGRVDAVTSNHYSDAISVLLNDGQGGFGRAGVYPVNAYFPYTVALADLDGDGRIDAVTADLDSDAVSVLLNHGQGGFAPATVHSTNAYAPYSVALGDLNGDGRNDVVAANGFSDSVSVLLNTAGNTGPFATGLISTNGVGGFQAQSRVAGQYGEFSMLSNGQWTYALNNASPLVQGLADGETVVELFVVTTADGSATETVQVTVVGLAG